MDQAVLNFVRDERQFALLHRGFFAVLLRAAQERPRQSFGRGAGGRWILHRPDGPATRSRDMRRRPTMPAITAFIWSMVSASRMP